MRFFWSLMHMLLLIPAEYKINGIVIRSGHGFIAFSRELLAGVCPFSACIGPEQRTAENYNGKSCATAAQFCTLQVNVFKLSRLQAKRDHMPVLYSFCHKLAYEFAATIFKWDGEALARGVLHGHRRDRLLRQCVKMFWRGPVLMSTQTLHLTVSAARDCYPKQKKRADDPGGYCKQKSRLEPICQMHIVFPS